MTAPQPELAKSVQLLAEINRLTLRAFKAKSAQQLIFLILNDTVPIVRYDRATLWQLDQGKITPKLLGVSGQSTVNRDTDISKKWLSIVKSIAEPEKPQIVSSPDLPAETSTLWLPLFSNEKLALGLWLERWNNVVWKEEEIKLLAFLMHSYGAAWERFAPRVNIRNILVKPLPIIGIATFLALFIIQVPLRIVSPCEIVPKDPVVISAPLEGIIEKIVVKPGQTVQKGELLVEYDKRVPLQDLRVAQKKVAIVKSEVDRATAQAQKDPKALAELGTETLKLKKEQIELDLAEYRASQLTIESPIDGIAMLDNPEEWHGKPVKVGEKIMLVSDPNTTKIRMWVPEDDNVVLDPEKPITVFLNVSPEKGRKAKLIYISSYTHVTEKQVPSFVAEADWMGDTSDVKLGLKGTAVLYGEDVTLFYWIIRRPLAFLRHYFGF